MIDQKLEEIRRRLLDLSRRNRLLNHRTKSQRSLQIVDELPVEIYRSLVEEGRTMQFLDREEAPEEIRNSLPAEEVEGPDDATALANGPALEGSAGAHLALAPIAENNTPAERHRDLKLQTLLSGEKLQTRLVHLAREASSALQEQGYNVLYLTLGMIEWREAGAEQTVSRAPLVFIPVELKRKTVNTRHTVGLFEDDPLTNACLVELCRTQFKLDLPLFDPEQDDLAPYFARVQERIATMKGWQFLPEIHLGLFSFSKMLMYRDLDPQNWPDAAQLKSHPLILQLAGIDNEMPDAGEGIPDPNTLDQLVKPADCFQVVDADSSQQAAILAAKRGLSMVIDGPPGTGKSQTITNIIAECLAEGRTVLFVSEKAAALEVVQKRLEQIGMGEFVLELHSLKTSKKAVLHEIQRALELQVLPSKISEASATELEQVRETLNAYRRDLHEPFGRLEISPFQAMSRAIGLQAEREVCCDIPDVAAWTREQLAEAEEKLQRLDRRLVVVGDPAIHPWRGVGLYAAGLKEKQRVRDASVALTKAISELLQCSATLASRLGRLAPTCLRDAHELLGTGRILLDSPRIPDGELLDDRWNSVPPQLAALLGAGRKRLELRLKWAPVVRPEAESQDWQDILAHRKLHGRSILRFFRPSWRADSKRIKSVLLNGMPAPLDKQIQLLETLIESTKLRSEIDKLAPAFVDFFGNAWTGPDSAWDTLEKQAQAAVAVRRLVIEGKVDAAIAAKIAGSDDRAEFAACLNGTKTALDAMNSARSEWLAAISSDETQWLKSDWPATELTIVRDRLAALPGQMDLLSDWTDLRHATRECSNTSLNSYVTWTLAQTVSDVRGHVANAFLRHFYRLWVEEAFAQRASLHGFRHQDHEALIERFRALDRRWMELTRQRLAERLAARRPSNDYEAHRQSKLGMLQAEFRKKTRHMPLRKLLASAAEVVQSIKPCLMMSPQSVAQYLSPGGLSFDIAIFDEASQLEEAHAYGPVARARQVLLVGDERQLPPTDFFERSDASASDEDAPDQALRVGDLENILSVGIVRFRHRCALRWHYRSRHSSLIEFSNQKFYDGQLRVFPSPHTDCSELGLAFRFVENGVYLRGSGRSNAIEAQTVAREVLRHATDHPEKSLGVGTLNLPQRMAIEDEIERMRRTSPDDRVEAFFSAHADEPFFVKNLENIQGDERDVIFLSVGFGKDANGRMSLNFGALNGDGGWRRLNVLITRARERCVVFSSLRSDDINLGGTQARGVVALKEYLFAAEHGHLKEAAVSSGDHDSEFEAAVCRSIRERGWEVHPQVGCAGFSIDLAVVDPRARGRYLLGIECDGATYHSSPTARDRDRLRQAVLENLGWQIHRIWSTDWFQRPRPVLDALLTRLEQLKQSSIEPAKRADHLEPSTPAESKPQNLAEDVEAKKLQQHPSHHGPVELTEKLLPGVVPYAHDRGGPSLGTVDTLLSLPLKRLAEIVRKLVDKEGPIHIDEVFRACAERFQTRASARPRDACELAVLEAIGCGWIKRTGNFVWPPDDAPVQVRHRGNGCPVTKPELIAPEEFEAAITLILRQQFGLQFDAIVEAVSRAFGFARTGPRLKDAIHAAIIQMDQRGEIQLDVEKFVKLRATTNGA